MENPNKNKAYFLWDVFQFFFFWKTISLSRITSPINIFFFFTLCSRGKHLFWHLCPLSHNLTVSSQFSPFSLLFSPLIFSLSLPLWSILLLVFIDLSLFASHCQQLIPCAGNIFITVNYAHTVC